MHIAMLTTTDNPFDPFDNYDEWFAYDNRMGYNTPGFLAWVAVVADELPESEASVAIEEAIDEIVRENVLGLYKKVTREVKAA